MTTDYLPPVPEGFVRMYGYETCNKDEVWQVNGFNWTTAEALIEYLARFPLYFVGGGGIKITHIDISIESLQKRPNMPFVSDYIREQVGLK